MAIWLGYALGDMFLFGLAAVLAKSGVRKNDSNLAAALWGTVIFIMMVVAVYVTGTGQKLTGIGSKSWLFLVLAGICMGAAWLCLFRSFRTGESIKIVPVFLVNLILTMLLRILLFHRSYGWNQIIAMILLAVGTLLIALHTGTSRKNGYVWLWFALLAAFFASASTLLVDYGASGVHKYVDYGIRSAVALVVAIIAASVVGGKGLRSMTFLDGLIICCSAVALGAGRICYERALALGPDNVVIHMDRLGVLAVLVLGCVFLRERLYIRSLCGYVLVVLGVFLMLLEIPLFNLFV